MRAASSSSNGTRRATRGRLLAIQTPAPHADGEPVAHRAAASVEVGRALPHLDKHIVQHIFGFGAAADDAHAQAQQQATVAVIETRQCLLISGGQPPHQGGVDGVVGTYRSRSHHQPSHQPHQAKRRCFCHIDLRTARVPHQQDRRGKPGKNTPCRYGARPQTVQCRWPEDVIMQEPGTLVLEPGHGLQIAAADTLDSFAVLATVRRVADIAQLVEQLIRNQQVRGSSPRVGSNKKNRPFIKYLDHPVQVLDLLFSVGPGFAAGNCDLQIAGSGSHPAGVFGGT